MVRAKSQKGKPVKEARREKVSVLPSDSAEIRDALARGMAPGLIKFMRTRERNLAILKKAGKL